MFNGEFHAQINALKGQVSARFNDIHAPNLGKIWEEVAILWIEACLLTKIQTPAISIVILLFTQLMSQHKSRYFDFLAEEETVQEDETQKAKKEDLYNPTIPFDQDLKKATHNHRVSKVDDGVRWAKIMMGAPFSSATPPPPPLSIEIPPNRDEHE